MHQPPPVDVGFSPCCKLPMMKLSKGQNELDHWRCTECCRMFIWNGQGFVDCQSPDKHYQLSQAVPLPEHTHILRDSSHDGRGRAGSKGR